MDAKEHIENAVCFLLDRNPFYGHLLTRMGRVFTSDPNFTATIGVRATVSGFQLIINSHFVSQFSVPALSEILRHECEHPLRAHFERETILEPDFNRKNANSQPKTVFETWEQMTKAQLLNYAEDVAINQDLNQERFPTTFKIFDQKGSPLTKEDGQIQESNPITLENFSTNFPDTQVLPNQSMEYYYGLLKNQTQPLQGKNQEILIGFDDHSLLQDSGATVDPDMLKTQIKQWANEAFEAAKGAGTRPDHRIIELLDKLNKASQNWKQELRNFKASISTIETETTQRRRNRRYGLRYPGYRNCERSHIVVAIDSSGSTERGWSQFFSELQSIAESEVQVTFIECDAAVQRVTPYTPNFSRTIKGGGGTLFQPVFSEIESASFQSKYGAADALIYFTDGENADYELNPPTCPVLWALLPNCQVSYSWGKKLNLKLKE